MALPRYEEFRTDLIIMDITMPGLDGVEAVKAVKGKFPEAKIIMISALGQEQKVRESILNGAMDFIVKPFDIEKVKIIIGRILKR